MTKKRAASDPKAKELFSKQHGCGRSCIFEPQQLEALLGEANKVSQYWGTLFATLALSGARVTEILTVKWKDVQANKLFLEPIKNDQEPHQVRAQRRVPEVAGAIAQVAGCPITYAPGGPEREPT